MLDSHSFLRDFRKHQLSATVVTVVIKWQQLRDAAEAFGDRSYKSSYAGLVADEAKSHSLEHSTSRLSGSLTPELGQQQETNKAGFGLFQPAGQSCTAAQAQLTSSRLCAVWPMILSMLGSGLMVKCACTRMLPSCACLLFRVHVSGTAFILSSPAAFHLTGAEIIYTLQLCHQTQTKTL